MPDLYELERRFRTADRELRDASRRMCEARDRLAERPVSEQSVQEYEFARHVVNTLFDKYTEAKSDLDRIDRDVYDAQRFAERLRAQFNRKKFLAGPIGLTVICSAEVILALLLSLVCLVRLPVGVWAVLVLIAAFGAVCLTILAASIHKRSDQPRLDYLANELESADRSILERGRGRSTVAGDVERAREMWAKADRVFQELKAQVRPKVRYDQAAREYDEVFQHYKAVREKYELAQTERRLGLLQRNWRDLRGEPFELFVREVFDCLGFVTELTRATGDQGIDVVAKDGVRWGIQCKGYADRVGNGAIQEAYTGRKIYSCNCCMVVTNSAFTAAAQEAAEHTGCVLISGRDLPALIRGEFRFEVTRASRA